MNPSEFKAWLNGFAQAIGEAPTAEQWKMVLQKAQSLGSIINFQPNDFERKVYDAADGRATGGQVTSAPSEFGATLESPLPKDRQRFGISDSY